MKYEQLTLFDIDEIPFNYCHACYKYVQRSIDHSTVWCFNCQDYVDTSVWVFKKKFRPLPSNGFITLVNIIKRRKSGKVWSER